MYVLPYITKTTTTTKNNHKRTRRGLGKRGDGEEEGKVVAKRQMQLQYV